MISFCGRDINSIYLNALSLAIESNISPTPSRNGDVYDFGPAYFEFDQPDNQLLLLRNRKFNPYFAVVESAWVLSGKKELKHLKEIIDSYSQFSDDGSSLNGAYGYRMRSYFSIDQLEALTNLLKDNPDTRRAVITLYSPDDLLNNKSLDLPCNTTLFFKKRNDKLDITVINRSNDLFLGIPYNVFMFNVVFKFIAKRIGLKTGVQRHFTDSLHLYLHDIDKVNKIINSNSNEEIDAWRFSLNTSNEIINCLIDHANEISTIDIENIDSPYFRNIFDNYLKFKHCKDPKILTSTLPDDAFGLSANLWLESFIQN